MAAAAGAVGAVEVPSAVSAAAASGVVTGSIFARLKLCMLIHTNAGVCVWSSVAPGGVHHHAITCSIRIWVLLLVSPSFGSCIMLLSP